MALLEREREEGRELRPTLTLELVVYDKTLVVGLRCCRRSVGRSVSRFGVASSNVSATVSITTHQSPVDPADHNERGGMASAVRRRVTTQLRCFALRDLIGACPCNCHVVTHRALSFYRYPSRELDFRCCALSSLSPTTHTTREGGNRL